METIVLRKDATAPDITGSVVWVDPVVITGASAVLVAEDKDGAVGFTGAVVISNIFEGPGTWSFDWVYDVQAADTSAVGTFYPHLDITYAGGDVESVPLCEDYLIEIKERRCAA